MKNPNIKLSVDLLLEICALMMQSGANTKRVVDTINRFADALHLESHALISHKSIIMTLIDKKTQNTYTVVTQIPAYHANFWIVSEISVSSWKAIDRNWHYDEIKNRIEQIKNRKSYPFILILFFVSLADAGFANLFGGDYKNMIMAFVATLGGLLTVKLANFYHFNPYIRTYFAAFIASAIAGIGVIYHFGLHPEIALATAVLFLIPGLALVNSFNDFLNNHILNGMVRFVNGFLMVLSIGLGIISTMLLLNLNTL